MNYLPRVREQRNSFSKGEITGYYSSTPPYVFESRWPATYSVDYRLDRCADETHPGPPWKSGGPCDIWHKTLSNVDLGSFDSTIYDTITGQVMYRYWGTLRPPDALANRPDPSGWLTTWGDGSSYGATAWNKFKPGKPGADLSVFLGELRDVPRMFQLKLKRFKDLGSQYLNYQFGWKPFLNDLRKFCETTQKLNQRLQYFRNNNGKPVRKGGVVRTAETANVVEAPTSAVYPASIGYFNQPQPVPTGHKRWEYTYTKTWFDAVFQFWIPDIDSPDWIPRVTRRLYGLNLSPSVVWELIPWSWLIDWFTNVGDVMSNLSNSDAAENLIARYAYLMTHTIYREEFTPCAFPYYFSRQGLMGPGKVVTLNPPTWYIQWERKQRIEANPYGFGLTDADLTLRQLAILAALGITRLF